MMGPLVPLALLILFAGSGRSGRRAAPRRRLYGPDPLRAMAPPVTDDFLIPQRDLQPQAPAIETHSELPPVPAEPLTAAPSWDPAQSPPPFAPPDAAFFPPLGEWAQDYPAPPVPLPDSPPEPSTALPSQYEAPPSQWQTPEQVSREQAARALAQHILTHRGSSRDRALIRRLQTALGVHSDGLIGRETLTAIDRYGRLNEQERAALQPER